MKLLGIETGGPFGGVAVVDDGGLRGELRLSGLRDYAERLVPWIDRLLAEVGLEPGEMDAVAVDIGPGSFTGVRVGVAAAQGMAVALGIPLVPVGSLEACAFAAGPTDLTVAVALDAGRGEVYGGTFRWTPNGPEALAEAGMIEPEEFLAGLKPPLHLSGSGLALLKKSALKRFGAGLRLPSAGWDGAPPWAVAALGLIRLRKGAGIDPAEVEPVYIRPPVARPPKKP